MSRLPDHDRSSVVQLMEFGQSPSQHSWHAHRIPCLHWCCAAVIEHAHSNKLVQSTAPQALSIYLPPKLLRCSGMSHNLAAAAHGVLAYFCVKVAIFRHSCMCAPQNLALCASLGVPRVNLLGLHMSRSLVCHCICSWLQCYLEKRSQQHPEQYCLCCGSSCLNHARNPLPPRPPPPHHRHPTCMLLTHISLSVTPSGVMSADMLSCHKQAVS